jgi:Mg-chelatase subunit ChlD
VLPGEADEFPRLVDHRALFRRACDGDPSATSELEESFVAELAEGAQDRVRVDTEHRSEVARGRETLAGLGLAVGDRSPDLGGHLLVQLRRFGSVDLDFEHGAIHNSSIVITELELSTVAPASPQRPPRTDDPEALFEEARRHRRRRWLRLAAVAGVLVAAGAGAYSAFSSGTTHSGGAAGRQGPLVTMANPTVVLLVDVSGSMRATDIAPGRLDAAVVAMRTFLTHLPSRSRVGLVAFSSNTAVEVAPTLDRASVLAALSGLSPEAGTALGDGLAAAVKLTVGSLARDGIRQAPGHYLPAAIVLESDGAQNRGTLTPLEAAQLAKDAGIRVDGVALGTPNGSVQYGYGQFSESIPVPPDPEAVQMIARLTGGEAFTATDADRLVSIYSQLGSNIAR